MADYHKLLEELITVAAKENASDLHISVGRHPVLRVAGQLVPLTSYAILTPEDSAGLVEAMLSKEAYEAFMKDHDHDFS